MHALAEELQDLGRILWPRGEGPVMTDVQTGEVGPVEDGE